MERGIPTEKILQQMRAATPPVPYLVGTPRGRLSQYEQKLAGLPWQVAWEGVSVKLLEEGQELYANALGRNVICVERDHDPDRHRTSTGTKTDFGSDSATA